MSSSHLRSLRSTWEAIQGTYVIQCDVTGCHLARANFAGDEEAQRVALERAEGQLSLLAEVEEALGEVLEEAGGQERAVRVTYYAHDVPFAMAGHEFVSVGAKERGMQTETRHVLMGTAAIELGGRRISRGR